MKTMCPPGYHHNGFILPHLASVRFEHSVCRGSLVTTNITLLALLVEHSLVHWYQQCGTVHHVPKKYGISTRKDQLCATPVVTNQYN